MLLWIHWVEKLTKFRELHNLIRIGIEAANHSNDHLIGSHLALHGQELLNVSIIKEALPCNIYALKGSVHAPVILGMQLTLQGLKLKMQVNL